MISHSALVDVLGLESLSEEEQEQRLTEVAQMVYDDVVIHALDILPEEMQYELDAEIAGSDDTSTATLGYFQRTISDFDTMVSQSLSRVLSVMGVEAVL